MKVGVNGAVRDISDLKVGVNGAVRSVSEAYVGVNGAVKKVWPLYKPVILDSKYDSNITMNSGSDQAFGINKNGWGFQRRSQGWFTYSYLIGGPIYAYYNAVANYDPDSAEGLAFNIKGGKFELIGAQRKVFPNDDYYGAITGDLSGFGLPITSTDGSSRSIQGWVGLSAKDENSFDTIYSFSYNMKNWYGNYQIGFGIFEYLISGVIQPGIAIGGLKADSGGYSRNLNCKKIGLQKG